MSEKLNTVNGQIILEGSNLPLSNLLVEVFTIDKFNVIPPFTETATTEEIRLASGLSGPEGSFSISFEDMELPDVFTDDFVPNPNLKNRKWYNLFLVIKSGNHLLYTTETREKAGRSEVFQITVPKTAFLEAGLSLPEESNQGKTLKEALKESLQKEKDLQEDIRELLQGELDHERSREAQKDEQFLKPLLNTLTRLPDSIRHSRYNFVNKGDSVAETTRQNISRKISYVFNRESLNKGPKSDGWIALNDEQQQALFKNDFKEEDGSYLLPEEISRQVFENILRNKAVGEANTTELLHKHPLHKYCTPISAQQKNCMTALGLELPGAHENAPAKGNDATASTEDGPFEANKDLQQYIDTQMQYAAAPEEPVRFGVGARATLAEIEEKVRALSLRPSPADMPAYFDFHSIQIAFEHVWQEAIDEGVLDLAGNVYDEIVNLGGTPPSPKENKVSFAAVKREVRTVARTAVIKKQDITIPKKVSEEFPSAANAWGRLTFQGRKMLEDHADKIQTYEKQMLLPFSNKYTLEQAIRRLRNKGNDMIRKATPATASSSSAPSRSKPGYEWVNGRWVRIKRGTAPNRQPQDLDELVNELEAQLKENNYSFTTYAANEKERSVNFGILVTYRQKWEPVSYQAGELVKTIPLAPKETRKYSKKETVKRKRIEKEIENSLKVLKTDSSETGRAESEIMDKALQKNSFQKNSSASGSYTIGAATANNTTSTNFTGDASRESRNLKKSFRENVFKAAQEYKNERKLEIVTEESFDSEYTESGEISNPNDELPVTYQQFPM